MQRSMARVPRTHPASEPRARWIPTATLPRCALPAVPQVTAATLPPALAHTTRVAACPFADATPPALPTLPAPAAESAAPRSTLARRVRGQRTARRKRGGHARRSGHRIVRRAHREHGREHSTSRIDAQPAHSEAIHRNGHLCGRPVRPSPRLAHACIKGGFSSPCQCGKVGAPIRCECIRTVNLWLGEHRRTHAHACLRMHALCGVLSATPSDLMMAHLTDVDPMSSATMANESGRESMARAVLRTLRTSSGSAQTAGIGQTCEPRSTA